MKIFHGLCHKYLLAYFPLFLVLSSYFMFPTSDVKKRKKDFPWIITTCSEWQPRQLFHGNWFVILGVEEMKSALIPEVTFLGPSLAAPLLFTCHSATACPFIISVSWLLLVEATELMIPMYLQLMESLGKQNHTLNFFLLNQWNWSSKSKNEILTDSSWFAQDFTSN